MDQFDPIGPTMAIKKYQFKRAFVAGSIVFETIYTHIIYADFIQNKYKSTRKSVKV